MASQNHLNSNSNSNSTPNFKSKPSSDPQSKPSRPPMPFPAPSLHPHKQRDFLLHLEAYLARRDGVDKLLKISRYAAKILLATPSRGGSFTTNLRSFEQSVGLSRKAFRLGKFIQDVNSLRVYTASKSLWSSPVDLFLAIVCFGGEGVYMFIEQFVWLSRAGFLPPKLAPSLQKASTYAELIGYFGSVALKTREMKKIESLMEKTHLEETDGEEGDKERLRSKLELKKLAIVQDAADGLMALSDVRQFQGFTGFSALIVASCGMLSALISTHRNWRAC